MPLTGLEPAYIRLEGGFPSNWATAANLSVKPIRHTVRMLNFDMLLPGFDGLRFGHQPTGAAGAAQQTVPSVAGAVPVHLRLILFQDCYIHVPAPGIEPGTTVLSEQRTTVVLDGGTGTGRITSFHGTQ